MGNEDAGQLGRYEIVKHLANGGMAQVLLAKATGIEGFARHVVVKRIHKQRTGDPAFVKMFLDEARLAATLHHHNIVQVHDIGQEGGEYFFAMEYIHGEDLRHLLTEVSKRREKVPFEHIVSIVMAAAGALHYAHEMRGPDRKPLGLVHRDVSPANIIVGYDGNVKVVDFGIAKAAALRENNTAGGMLKGKVSYMAPEQCAGKPIDRRSDVYALGVVLYELVTVRRLFKSDNDFLTMSAIVQGDVPFPSKHRADVPPGLEDIIFKALSVSPDRRYASADEMKRALDEFASSAGLRTSTSALADYMKSVFGDKPEPWLTDDPGTELELSIDFDGSADGIAEVPATARAQLKMPATVEPTPTAPIVHARTKAITENPATRASALPVSMPRRSKAPSVMIPAKRPTRGVPVVAGVATIPARSTPVAGVITDAAVPPQRPTPPPLATPRRSTPAPITIAPAMSTTPLPPPRPTPLPSMAAASGDSAPNTPTSRLPALRRNTPPAMPATDPADAALATAEASTTAVLVDASHWNPNEKSASGPLTWPTGTDARVSSEQAAVAELDLDDDAATFIATSELVEANEPNVEAKLEANVAPAAAPAVELGVPRNLEPAPHGLLVEAPAAVPVRRTKLWLGIGAGVIAVVVGVMLALSGGDSTARDATETTPVMKAPPQAPPASDEPITPPNLAKEIVTGDNAGANTADTNAGSNTADTNAGSDTADTNTADTNTTDTNTTGTNTPDTNTTDTNTTGANTTGTKPGTTARTNPIKPTGTKPQVKRPTKPPAAGNGTWNPDQLFPE